MISKPSTPKLFGGFNTSLSWRNIDLNAVFGFSLGGKIYNYSRQEYDADGTYTDRNQMKLKDGWNRWENLAISQHILFHLIIINQKQTALPAVIWKIAII